MDKPRITLGVLGSYTEMDFFYNVNTYLHQNFDDYEIVFSFDKKQYIDVPNLIALLNMHRYDIENKIRILHKEPDLGIVGNAKNILEHAKGDFVLFISMEDAFYDGDALKAVAQDSLDHNITVFQTLIKLNLKNLEWQIFRESETVCVCYKTSWLKDNFKSIRNKPIHKITDLHYTFLQMQESKIVFNTTSNIIVHSAQKKYETLDAYYFPEKDCIIIIKKLIKEYAKFKCGEITYSQHKKLCEIANDSNSSAREKIAKYNEEFYVCYKDVQTSQWKNNYYKDNYLVALAKILKNVEFHKISLCTKRKAMKYSHKFRKQIKLVFFVHEYATFSTFQSIYLTSIREQNIFSSKLVYVPFGHAYSRENSAEEMNRYRQVGYEIVACEEYHLDEEAPDYAFYLKPYDLIPDRFKVQEVIKVVSNVIYIPYAMEIGNITDSLYYQCYTPMHFLAKYITAYSKAYYEKMKKYGWMHGENYLKIGHPRMDLLGDSALKQKSEYKLLLDKLQGRKAILWNTHFDIQGGDQWGTFLDFGKSILDYFYQNKSLVLIWRPHPLFYKSLAAVQGTEIEETMDWIYKIADYENIFLDQNSDYLSALTACDAVISDWSSIVPEALLNHKKVLVTQSVNGQPSLFSNVKGLYDIALTQGGIESFLDEIRCNDITVNDNVNLEKYFYFPDHSTVAEHLLSILR